MKISLDFARQNHLKSFGKFVALKSFTLSSEHSFTLYPTVSNSLLLATHSCMLACGIIWIHVTQNLSRLGEMSS